MEGEKERGEGREWRVEWGDEGEEEGRVAPGTGEEREERRG